ncbi:hypothetical protein ABPG77_003644 [Micractinium sp. CCAP 211/92]
MTSYSGLLELRGSGGHSVLDLPPGVLEAATHTVPEQALHPFVATLLFKCSSRAGRNPITLGDVILATALFELPGISQAHLLAFQRRVWPRQATMAQLEQYENMFSGAMLRNMDPKLRQLVETVFAQESERVRAAVLQHLLDHSSSKLIAAPTCLELVLTDEAPSKTIPDDPRLHQLLRQLYGEVLAELRRQGRVVQVQQLPPAVPPAVALRQLAGMSSPSEECSPGTPPAQDSSSDTASAAASSADNCGLGAPGPGPAVLLQIQQVPGGQAGLAGQQAQGQQQALAGQQAQGQQQVLAGQQAQGQQQALAGQQAQGQQQVLAGQQVAQQSLRRQAIQELEAALVHWQVAPWRHRRILSSFRRELRPYCVTLRQRLRDAGSQVVAATPEQVRAGVEAAWNHAEEWVLDQVEQALEGMFLPRRWLLEALPYGSYLVGAIIIILALRYQNEPLSGVLAAAATWDKLAAILLLPLLPLLQLLDPLRIAPSWQRAQLAEADLNAACYVDQAGHLGPH